MQKLLNGIERLQAIMVAYVTDGRNETQPDEYKKLFIEVLLSLEKFGYLNPNKFRTLEEFWGYCKLKEIDTWAARRAFINSLYSDVIIDIQRKLHREPDPKEWIKANEILTDELNPVRNQWLKAKNFLLGPYPDMENCIKESINSIESTLQIFQNQPKQTLGKLLQNVSIDEDIKKIISKCYGLVSNKDFVRHGGTTYQNISKEDAEFFLNFSAISIRYLKSKLSD